MTACPISKYCRCSGIRKEGYGWHLSGNRCVTTIKAESITRTMTRCSGASCLVENIQNFAEDARGNILLQESTALHVVGADGSVKDYDSVGKEPIRNCVAISRSSSGHFNILEGGKVFEFSDKGFSFLFPITFPTSHPNFIAMSPSWIVWRETTHRASIRSLVTGKTYTYRPFGFDSFHPHQLFPDGG